MSNRTNHRRGNNRRSEHGPRWEHSDPGKGCNSTHVARARAAWKRLGSRASRRAGKELLSPDHDDLAILGQEPHCQPAGDGAHDEAADDTEADPQTSP